MNILFAFSPRLGTGLFKFTLKMFSNSKSADTKVYDTAIDLFYNLRKSYF